MVLNKVPPWSEASCDLAPKISPTTPCLVLKDFHDLTTYPQPLPFLKCSRLSPATKVVDSLFLLPEHSAQLCPSMEHLLVPQRKAELNTKPLTRSECSSRHPRTLLLLNDHHNWGPTSLTNGFVTSVPAHEGIPWGLEGSSAFPHLHIPGTGLNKVCAQTLSRVSERVMTWQGRPTFPVKGQMVKFFCLGAMGRRTKQTPRIHGWVPVNFIYTNSNGVNLATVHSLL